MNASISPPSAPVLPLTADRSAPKNYAKRFLPGLILAAGVAIFFGLGWNEYLSLDALRQHHAGLNAFVAAHSILAGGLFVLVYAAATATSIPGALLLTITGGLLFGTALGTALAVLGATTGATILFIVARSAFGDVLRSRAGTWVERMAEGFRHNAFSYLLVLRLLPLVPFFVVNLVPAFLGVRLRTYILATLLGIIPGAFVYASVGVGLGDVLGMGGSFSLAGILTPNVVTALVGFAILSLAPVAYKRIKKQRDTSALKSSAIAAPATPADKA